jgi:hypothetical protein
MNIFVSSTYLDLSAHRQAVNEILLRIKSQFSAMEYFGSRTDNALEASFKEIMRCDILVGIYAWRYGWQPSITSLSITEQEFDYASKLGKKCLCYVVDENHPWSPSHIDHGEPADHLVAFKRKVGNLVRSRFTTPDNLAKQVAADLSRELSHAPSDSFGGLLRVNWEVFAPDLQLVLSTAYSQAKYESEDGVVASRHVIAALAGVPNSAQPFMTTFRRVDIPRLLPNVRGAEVEELFAYDRPMSSCVLGSMSRLLPTHSEIDWLLAIELAVDLLKTGRGESIAMFRKVGVDAEAVMKVEDHLRRIAHDPDMLRKGAAQLTDAEIIHLAYLTDTPIQAGLMGEALRKELLQYANERGLSLLLAGEMIRRHPRLVGL